MTAAYDFINEDAPEHLEILSTRPFEHLGELTEAAKVLLGFNNVLPTSAGVRSHRPLSVMDFMKRSSIGYVTAKGWPDMSKAARKLAEYEGFSSHANAVGPMHSPNLGQGD